MICIKINCQWIVGKIIRKCKVINKELEDLDSKYKHLTQELTSPQINNENNNEKLIVQQNKEEKKNSGTSSFPIYGDSSTYNINDMLRKNILNCVYFHQLLYMGFDDLIEQIKFHCKNAEPWAACGNNLPSTLFCCLYKFMQIKLTGKMNRATNFLSITF